MLTLSYSGRYWIKWGSTSEGYNNAVTHYDKNNIYISGQYSTTKNATIRKTSIGGECQWIRELGNGTNQTISFSVDTDSFGNVYICGINYLTVGNDFIVAKYNSLGVLQWKKKLNVAGDNGASALKVSASNDIYICGWTNQFGAGETDLLTMKLDLSGNILWQKTLGSAGTELGYTLTLDSSENVIISAYNVDDILIIKYNSSGTLQWQRKFGKVKVGTYDNEFAPSVAVDSSDNIYIVGYSITESIGFFGETTYLFDGVIAKYNSSGVIQWQKKVTSASGSYVQFYGITIDLNNNLYITGGCTVDIGAYRYPVYVAKLNSSGVVQWQRGLYRASTSSVSYALINYGYSISFDEYEDLCIVGTTTYSSTGIYNKYYPLAFKVPSDGSLTGDYGVFRYGSVSLTYSNGTYADSATTFTDSSSTFSLTNSTLTDSASSCSYDNLIEMPDNSEKLSISIEEIMPTNGLVNYLNVANRNSYPGSGTTWYDLSGNNRNGTISGSYSDGSLFFNPGYVEFSQYNFGNEFTFIAFINPTTKNTISALFANSSAGSFTNGIRIFINFDGANTRTLHIELGNGSSSQLITSASNTVTYGVWQQVAFTLNKSTAKGAIYHNGIKVKEDNLNFTNFNSNDRFDFGTIRGAYSYLGRLSSFTTYNRALTESEIKDIYKLRYSNENGLSIFNLNI